MMGDFKAKIGANNLQVMCRKFGLGEANQRGQLLLNWLRGNKLEAANTCVKH